MGNSETVSMMSEIGGLMIGIDVDIQRTDGRIHTAVVSAINREMESVTVEWFEKGEAKGKELEFEVIYQLNPLLTPVGWKNKLDRLFDSEKAKKSTDDDATLRPKPVSQSKPSDEASTLHPKALPTSKSTDEDSSNRTHVQYVIPFDSKAKQIKPPKPIISTSSDHQCADREKEDVAKPSSDSIPNQKGVEFCTNCVRSNPQGMVKVSGLSDSTPNLTAPVKQRRSASTCAIDTEDTQDETDTSPSRADKVVTFESETTLCQLPVRQTPNRRTQRSQRRTSCLQEIEKIQQRREERRAAATGKGTAPPTSNLGTTNAVSNHNLIKTQLPEFDFSHPEFEFYQMIREYQETLEFRPLTINDPIENHRICVCVRKRPLNRKETMKQMIDVVTIPSKSNVLVHEPKVKVDLTKYVEHQSFRFDFAFDAEADNAMVYRFTAQPLVEFIFEGGMATCFAYGQTGSGKTHTMGGDFTSKGNQDCTKGIYAMAATDVFALKDGKYYDDDLNVEVSYFEIYSGKVFDLLNSKKKLRVLEDAKGQVQIVGLKSQAVTSMQAVLDLLQVGSNVRTSGTTSANQQSSRSHAVFQLAVKKGRFRKLLGKFSLIDLAGNERGADTNSADRITRMEGAEINKSLLALKECIRALGRRGAHLPFRGSKLTQVLRDSFIGDRSRTCMIAMISPGSTSCEHSLNTLRYADRVKELCPTSGTSSAPTPSAPGGTGPYEATSNFQTDAPHTDTSPSRRPGDGSTIADELQFNGRNILQQINKNVERKTNDTSDNAQVMASFHEVIDHIEEMEEDISDQHKSIVELMPVWARKHKNLHKMSNKPEYDVDVYANSLDELLGSQIEALKELKDKVILWRQELKAEEEMSHKLISNGTKSKPL